MSTSTMSSRIVIRIMGAGYSAFMSFCAYIIGPLVDFVEQIANLGTTSFTLYGRQIVRERDGSVALYHRDGSFQCRYTPSGWLWTASSLQDLIILGDERSVNISAVTALYGARVVSKEQLKKAEAGGGIIRDVRIGDRSYDLRIVEFRSEIEWPAEML